MNTKSPKVQMLNTNFEVFNSFTYFFLNEGMYFKLYDLRTVLFVN